MTRTVRYELLKEDAFTAARRGRLHTPHGSVELPAFMPVGTAGSVKAMLPEEVALTGAQIILGNTYHLMIQPGHRLIASLGGLHEFAQWPHTLLTDSGGFQVLSLKERRTITEEGVRFHHPRDGNWYELSPEISIEVQEALGTDIAMAFDECPPHDQDRQYIARSMERTTRWLDRCIAARRQPERTALFGIVQGGLFDDLRRIHLDQVLDRDLDGYAVGGVAIGESKPDMERITALTAAGLPKDRPRYLMGVGHPDDLVTAVAAGIDMFDCVVPTRNARNGCLFTSTGRLIIKNARYRDDGDPIDPACRCPTCRQFSRAYIRHLWMSQEILAHRLTTMHNLWFFGDLMRRMRTSIAQDRMAELVREVRSVFGPSSG